MEDQDIPSEKKKAWVKAKLGHLIRKQVKAQL